MLILQLNQLFREIKFVFNFVCDDDIAFISVVFDKNYAIVLTEMFQIIIVVVVVMKFILIVYFFYWQIVRGSFYYTFFLFVCFYFCSIFISNLNLGYC